MRNGYTSERSLDFYRQVRENRRRHPGVESSALAIMPVLGGDEWDESMAIEGFVYKPTEAARSAHAVDFAGLLQYHAHSDSGGPRFPHDRRPRRAQGLRIVNEKFARRYFKDGNALGRHIGMGGDPGTKLDIEIVGVVRDTKYESMRDEIPVEVYRPSHQMPFVLNMMAYVRTARQPEQTFLRIRQVVNQLDSNLPVSNMKTLEKQQEESLITERLVATLSTGFGILATLLAAIGLYGVMAYIVAQRTREIGFRMALGAASTDVIWLVIKEVLLLAGIGIAIGLPAAYALTRFAKSQLYGIEPNDALTIVWPLWGSRW